MSVGRDVKWCPVSWITTHLARNRSFLWISLDEERLARAARETSKFHNRLLITIIMLSISFSLYIRYTAIFAYCTDIHVISVFHVYTLPRRGIETRGLLRTFDPAFCAHFWTDLLFPKFCIIFHFFW